MKKRVAVLATGILAAGMLILPSASQARSSWSVHFDSGPYWYGRAPRAYYYAPPPCGYYVRAYPRYYGPVYYGGYYGPVGGGFSLSYYNY